MMLFTITLKNERIIFKLNGSKLGGWGVTMATKFSLETH